MLILSRKPGECIIIGDDIIIRVLPPNKKINRTNEVRLGIEAPIGTKVHREEVYLKIQEEKG